MQNSRGKLIIRASYKKNRIVQTRSLVSFFFLRLSTTISSRLLFARRLAAPLARRSAAPCTRVYAHMHCRRCARLAQAPARLLHVFVCLRLHDALDGPDSRRRWPTHSAAVVFSCRPRSCPPTCTQLNLHSSCVRRWLSFSFFAA